MATRGKPFSRKCVVSIQNRGLMVQPLAHMAAPPPPLILGEPEIGNISSILCDSMKVTCEDLTREGAAL